MIPLQKTGVLIVSIISVKARRRARVVIVALAAAMMLAGCGSERPPNTVFSLEDVNGKVIGALNGTPSARLADDLGEVRTYLTGEQLIEGLIAGAVDCAVMESVTADELVAGEPDVKLLGETLLEYDLRFAVPRENSELLRYVNSALAALEANGSLKGLRDKYFSGGAYVYSPPEDVAPHPGILTLAVPPDSAPYSYKDADGEYTGLDIEVARALCDYLGVGLQIIEVAPGDLITAVWFGRAELASGWLPGDVDDQVSISDAYANAVHVIIVRK